MCHWKTCAAVLRDPLISPVFTIPPTLPNLTWAFLSELHHRRIAKLGQGLKLNIQEKKHASHGINRSRHILTDSKTPG